MTETPEVTYDSVNQVVYVEHEGTKVELYDDVAPSEFDTISEVEDLHDKSVNLIDQMILTIRMRERLIREGDYFSALNTLQEDASQSFDESRQLQSRAQQSPSDPVQAQLDRLYKLEKFLKHYFRQLSVAQSLGYSQRLLFIYLASRDHVFLYGLVRNACSTLEYLGKLYEGRCGKGKLGGNDKSVTFKRVYSELKKQELTETFEPEQEAVIPGEDEMWKMKEMQLDPDEIDFIWKMRNEIVHHCPLVMADKTNAPLPDDLINTSIIRQTDIHDLTQFASRVHLHSIGIFLRFVHSYHQDLADTLVEAWYHQRE